MVKRRQTLISKEEACSMEEVDNLESGKNSSKI
jgi:hypothetical protein